MTRCPRCQRRVPVSGECPDHGRPTAVEDVAVPSAGPNIAAPRGWSLGAQLAVGGTSHVYQVRGDGNRSAVLKVGRWGENEIRARFSVEAEVLRAVGAPAVPELYEQGLVNELPYLIMEHVSGETLAMWMARTGDRGGMGEIVAILTRLAAALSLVHAKGYIHRDLKPENIVIGSRGVRLIDFGLVKPMRPSSSSLTQIGSVVGTPHYLAPEQIRMGSMIDPRADIYSFGVVAFEMLAGRPPFTGDRRAIEYQHVACRPPSVRETRAIPRPIDDVVMACLAKQAESRPASAEELRVMLSNALNSAGTLRGVAGTAEVKQDSRPLGAQVPVALAWIERADPVMVTRAVTEVNGIVVARRGDGIVAAFSTQHHDAPLSIALDVCRPMIGERRRIVIHVTTALVRRSAQGKVMIYGPDVDQIERWIPAAPYTGLLLTASAAQATPGVANPTPEMPGFFREAQRDRTDATDAKIEPPLIGRDELLRSLVGAAASSTTMLVGISGGSGSGKSRVLRALTERLLALGRIVVSVSGRRRFPGDRPDDDRLVAALGGGADVIDALRNAAKQRAILVVDDLQWFSRSVRAALLAPPEPLVRVVASAQPQFEAAMGSEHEIAVDLPPLSYAGADALLREMLRPARLIPDALIERLVVRGMGNPGLLIGLARDMKQRGAIRRQPGGADWYVAIDELDTLLAPPDPSWFASRMLEELPVELSPIVRACAGLGPKFCGDEVASIIDARDLDARMALLVREGVFAERNGWYEFQDPSMQEAIYEHALDERLSVHQRALRFWFARRDRNKTGRLARIAFHAASSGQRLIAMACWAALARQAVHTGDLDYADELLERAVGMVTGVVPAEVAEAIAGHDDDAQ